MLSYDYTPVKTATGMQMQTFPTKQQNPILHEKFLQCDMISAPKHLLFYVAYNVPAYVILLFVSTSKCNTSDVACGGVNCVLERTGNCSNATFDKT